MRSRLLSSEPLSPESRATCELIDFAGDKWLRFTRQFAPDSGGIEMSETVTLPLSFVESALEAYRSGGHES